MYGILPISQSFSMKQSRADAITQNDFRSNEKRQSNRFKLSGGSAMIF